MAMNSIKISTKLMKYNFFSKIEQVSVLIKNLHQRYREQKSLEENLFTTNY